MKEAMEVKARAQELRARKAELEGALAQAPDDTQSICLELARIQEELVDCARELRELMPRHKVSYKTTWAGVEGRRWDQMQYQTWAELEGSEEQDGPTEQELMRLAMRVARERLTDKQEEYLSASETGTSATQIALDKGVDKSTVSTTLKRAHSKMEQEAKALYSIMKQDSGMVRDRIKALQTQQAALEDALSRAPEENVQAVRQALARVEEELADCARELRETLPRRIAAERTGNTSSFSRTTKIGREAKALEMILKQRSMAGTMVIDLSDPEVLRAVLRLLTDKQQIYLYLYYGEWLSLREIGDLIGVSHSVVLRSIRSALEHLDRILMGQKVAVKGLDALEERLIGHFNREELSVESDKPAARTVRKALPTEVPHRPAAFAPTQAPAPVPLNWTMTFTRGGELRTAPMEQYIRPSFCHHWGSGRLIVMLKKRLAPSIRVEDAKDYKTLKRRLNRAIRECLKQLFCLIRRELNDADNH